MSTFTPEATSVARVSSSSDATRPKILLWAGLAFALLFPASFVLGSRSDIHDTSSHTLTYYADDYNKAKGMLGWALAVMAVIALVWFLAEIVSVLRAAGSTASQALTVALAGGVLAATLAIAGAIRAAPVGDLLQDSEKRAGTTGKLTPAFATFSQTTGSLYDWLIFFGVGLGAAALVLAVSLASRRTGLVSRWLRWVGYAVVPVLAFVAFINVLLLTLWFIAVTITVFRRSREKAPSTSR